MIEANVFLWTIEGLNYDILPWSLVGRRRHYRLWILRSRLLYVSLSLNVRHGSIKIRFSFQKLVF